ncbi:hypothetical protein F2Q68_00045865 [Brassica cretica]|uniref:Uncharacterized protein n=1 Tax=Brassica cretica TaxID=69181 RepID=A0A8S9LKT5_BRACR|nr:hypothetical protein F2Q68_00045865 [Brassica cretica]
MNSLVETTQSTLNAQICLKFQTDRFQPREPERRTIASSSPSHPSGNSNQRRYDPNTHQSPPQLHTKKVITNVNEGVTPAGSERSRERRSALERIADPDLREQLQHRSTPSRDSSRLQEVKYSPTIHNCGRQPSPTPLLPPLLQQLIWDMAQTEHQPPKGLEVFLRWEAGSARELH